MIVMAFDINENDNQATDTYQPVLPQHSNDFQKTDQKTVASLK